MKKFILKIKEVANDHPLTPSRTCDDSETQADVEKFFGVHEPGVEWYEIKEEKL